MKKNKLHRRSLSALLALVLALTMVPVAAAGIACPLHNKTCRETQVVEATCSQKGKGKT